MSTQSVKKYIPTYTAISDECKHFSTTPLYKSPMGWKKVFFGYKGDTNKKPKYQFVLPPTKDYVDPLMSAPFGISDGKKDNNGKKDGSNPNNYNNNNNTTNQNSNGNKDAGNESKDNPFNKSLTLAIESPRLLKVLEDLDKHFIQLISDNSEAWLGKHVPVTAMPFMYKPIVYKSQNSKGNYPPSITVKINLNPNSKDKTIFKRLQKRIVQTPDPVTGIMKTIEIEEQVPATHMDLKKGDSVIPVITFDSLFFGGSNKPTLSASMILIRSNSVEDESEINWGDQDVPMSDVVATSSVPPSTSSTPAPTSTSSAPAPAPSAPVVVPVSATKPLPNQQPKNNGKMVDEEEEEEEDMENEEEEN